MENRVTMAGRVSNPEKKQIGAKGTTLLTFALLGKSGSGKYEKEARIDCNVFGKLADGLALVDGDEIRVEGQITSSRWEKGDKVYYFTKLDCARIERTQPALPPPEPHPTAGAVPF